MMYARVKPHTYVSPMHTTSFPLQYKGKTYDQYYTYWPHTWQYLKCLLFGHTGITYTDVSLSAERGLEGCVPARCCERTYYNSKGGKA